MKKAAFLFAAVMTAALISACGGQGEKPAQIEEAAKVEEEQPLSIQEQLELGRRYLVELNYEEAIIVFTGIIDVEPRNVEAWTGLATAYAQTQNFGEAAKAYTVVTEERPDDPDAHYMLGITHVLNGDQDDGEQALMRGLELARDENGVVSDEALQQLFDDFDSLGITIQSEEEAEYYHAYVLEMPDGSHVRLIRYPDGSVSAEVLDAGEEVPEQAIPDTLTGFVWKNKMNQEYSGYIDTVVFGTDGNVTVTSDSGESMTFPYYISGGDEFYPEGAVYIGSPDFMAPEAMWAAYFTEYEGRKGMGLSGIHVGEFYFLEPVRP
ncbi:MAG: tetratricopeptide repeat protein [Lachnospiraceae bacterium]|nr:tetratricopeptide repeat protein [Lachnospiraceae bacterium]